MMSSEKSTNNNNTNRRHKNNEVEAIDPMILKSLEDNYIHQTQKASSTCPRSRFICRMCFLKLLSVEKATKHSNDVLHKNNIKKSCKRNIMKYLPHPTEIQLKAIDNCLRDTLKLDIFISDAEFNRRNAMCNDMNSIADLNSCHLLPCGSLATGLSMKNVSDVNLYLDTMSNKTIGYFSILKKLSSEFSQKLNLKTDVKLEKNNSGLFCRDIEGVTYHISDGTRMNLLTSDLLVAYMKIDERAEKLIQIFRYFANQAFIDRTQDGLLPVQVLSLLVVFYLQQLSIPILPNLHKLANIKSVKDDSSVKSVTVDDFVIRYMFDLSTIRSQWTPAVNNASLAELWVGLLRFYAIEFDSSHYIVSIRCSEPVLKFDRNIKNKRLAVEDPFDVKSNMLLSFYLPDAVEFFTHQLETCYLYFGVPQLSSGPAFTSVKFTEITQKSLSSTCLVTPTFNKDNFTVCVELMETEFKTLYRGQCQLYDCSKWPVSLFIKTCLSTILTSVFDSKLEIDSLLMVLEIKSNSNFTIVNESGFKEYAMSLAMRVFQDFSAYFERTGTWNGSEICSKSALEIIKKASKKFITESLNITINEENDDDVEEVNDDDFEACELENNEPEADEMVEDVDTSIAGDAEESFKAYMEINNAQKTVKGSENWKLPISFMLIRIQKNGIVESSNEIGVYNEHRINSLHEEQLEYSFRKMPIKKTKLEIVCYICKKKGHRKEFCSEAVPKFDGLKRTLCDITKEWLSKLKPILMQKYNAIVLSQDRKELHQNIFADIRNIIKKLYPISEPQLFGSSKNGFMIRTSDLDICVEMFHGETRQRLPQKEVSTILKDIGKEMRQSFPNMDLQLILSAKVPIIKFFLPNNVQGDISVNNILGLENSKMLKLYSDLHGDMRILGNLIKYMSKSCEIGDASQGTLSSYTYIVMLIHFMQRRGLLPVLQELYEGAMKPTRIVDGYNAWYQSDINIINKLWKRTDNGLTLEYLWLDFFYYYTVEFDIDKEVVTIKQSEPLFKIDKGWQMSYLAIEDPFNTDHNMGRALSIYNFRFILFSFAHVLKIHSNNENLKRNDNAHYLLMEPMTLMPRNTDIRSYSNQSQDSRTSTGDQNTRRTTKSESEVKKSGPVQLPKITLPFLLKESTIPNSVYIETDRTESALNLSIRLKSFNSKVEDLSVVPISLNFGNKSIVIPMLTSKDDCITNKLNSLYENGYKNNCSIPLEFAVVNPKRSEMAQNTQHSLDSVDRSRNNSSHVQNAQTRTFYGPIKQPDPIPNPVRLMATNLNYGNPYPYPGYANYQYHQYRAPLPREFHDRAYNGAPHPNGSGRYTNPHARPYSSRGHKNN